MKKVSLILLFIIFIGQISFSQVLDPVKWNYYAEKVNKNEYELKFVAAVDKGWHIYGLNVPEDGPVATSIVINKSKDYSVLPEIRASKESEVKYDSTFKMNIELYDGEISFSQRIKVLSQNDFIISGIIEFMSCDDSRCLPPQEVEFSFNYDHEKQDVIAGVEDEIVKISSGTEDVNEPSGSLTGFFLLALLAGFAALLTPCVYPIIPLTVSYFMKESNSKKQGIFGGLVFGISIVLIYTVVGLIIGLFRIDLARMLSGHWIPNIVIFLIFIVFAISFFGSFEIMLPAGLANKIDRQADKGGILGPFFMALATVVISFSCTGPIIGILLGNALQGDVLTPVVGMFGFSISFAIPFTLLAIFPNMLKSIPKSGGWLNSVKVSFAFIMLAFSFKFLSNINEIYHLDILDRQIYLIIWIGISGLLGLYLMGKIKFSHDSEVKHLSVFRIFMIITVFSFTIYLVTGLSGSSLKGVSGLLPPEGIKNIQKTEKKAEIQSAQSKSSICENAKYSDFLSLPHNLNGYFDIEQGIHCAKELNKPVFISFGGHSCTNCKKMYSKVWSDDKVLNRLKNDFVIVSLYVDDKFKLPGSEKIISEITGKEIKTLGKKNLDFQISKFNTNALPVYAIVDHDVNVLTGRPYYTYNPDIENFIRFLDEGIKNYQSTAEVEKPSFQFKTAPLF